MVMGDDEVGDDPFDEHEDGESDAEHEDGERCGVGWRGSGLRRGSG